MSRTLARRITATVFAGALTLGIAGGVIETAATTASATTASVCACADVHYHNGPGVLADGQAPLVHYHN